MRTLLSAVLVCVFVASGCGAATPTPPAATLEGRIEQIVKKHEPGNTESLEIRRNDDILQVTYFGRTTPLLSALSYNATAPEVYAIAPGVRMFRCIYKTTFVDKYGAETQGVLARIGMSRAVADKVVWENFLVCNLHKVSEIFWLHPSETPAWNKRCGGAASVVSDPTRDVDTAPDRTAPGAITTPLPPVELSDCTPDAKYIKDITIPDGTTFKAGEAFVKTWQLKNAGGCAWGAGYELVHVSGPQLGDTKAVSLPETSPGGLASVSVPMKAPGTGGEHKSYWQASVNGRPFGTKVYVQIIAEGAVGATSGDVVNAEELAYIQAVGPKLIQGGEAAVLLGNLLQSPFFEDELWRLSVRTQTTIIQSTRDNISTLSPPDDLSSIHRVLLSSFNDLSQACDLILAAIDKQDQGLMEEAAPLTVSAGAKMGQFKALWEEWMAAHDLD